MRCCLEQSVTLNKRDNKNMAFASYYIDMESKKLMSESGFEEMPYIVPRFLKATGEVMGRSPAMVALPDVKMLNLMSKQSFRPHRSRLTHHYSFPMTGLFYLCVPSQGA